MSSKNIFLNFEKLDLNFDDSSEILNLLLSDIIFSSQSKYAFY